MNYKGFLQIRCNDVIKYSIYKYNNIYFTKINNKQININLPVNYQNQHINITLSKKTFL